MLEDRITHQLNKRLLRVELLENNLLAWLDNIDFLQRYSMAICQIINKIDGFIIDLSM